MRASWVDPKPEPVKTKMLTNTDGWAGGCGDGIDVAAKPRVNSLMQQRLTKHNTDRLRLVFIQILWRASLLRSQTTRILTLIQIVNSWLSQWEGRGTSSSPDTDKNKMHNNVSLCLKCGTSLHLASHEAIKRPSTAEPRRPHTLSSAALAGALLWQSILEEGRFTAALDGFHFPDWPFLLRQKIFIVSQFLFFPFFYLFIFFSFPELPTIFGKSLDLVTLFPQPKC